MDNGEIIKAFELAQTYVYALHMTIAGAMGHENTVVRPDLDKVDKAIAELKKIFEK